MGETTKGDNMKLEIRKGKSGKWYWRIKATNGRIVCHSETYSSKSKAIQTAKQIVKNEIFVSSQSV